MSLVINLLSDSNKNLFAIEDAHTGTVIDQVGKWVQLDDDVDALQLRVIDLRNRSDGDESICPSCLRVIPPPPPDLSWKRSLP